MPDYILAITTPAAGTDAKPAVTERLVRAKNKATAFAHVVKDVISVASATSDDVIRLTQAGVKLEVAE